MILGVSSWDVVWFLLFIAVSADGLTVYINQEDGITTEECLKESVSTPCKNLSSVAEQVGTECHELTIVIQSDLELDAPVSFANCTSLRVESANKHRSIITGLDNGTSCGLLFRNITNLTVSSISLSHCSSHQNVLSGCIHVHQSANLTITDIQITNVTGTGLVLHDIQGSNVIENSKFAFNNVSKALTTNKLFAGGVHVEFSRNETERPTSLVMRDCLFEHNTQWHKLRISPHGTSHSPDLNILYGYGNGGGMSVIFMEAAQRFCVILDNCTFTNNTANSGGGLYVHFQDYATDNLVTVNGSTFRQNLAKGGGGMSIGMGKQLDNVTFNSVHVTDTLFAGNHATYGGGTALFALHSIIFTRFREEMVTFLNCSWNGNAAHYSAAFDISPFQYDPYNQGFLPSPSFEECRFKDNKMIPGPKDNRTEFRSTGIFVVTSFEVIFKGSNHFEGNKYTALRLTSATVILRPNTSVYFEGNRGVKGGAVAMYGFSMLKGKEGCELIFEGNSASQVGGAIFYKPFEQREYIAGTRCFIQYIGTLEGSETPDWIIRFVNNSATLAGTAIYSSSFYSCFFAHFGSFANHNLSDFFQKIGHFEFQEDPDVPYGTTTLATDGDRFVLEHNSSLEIIPGKRLDIPLHVQDEFNHTVKYPMGLEITNTRGSLQERTKYYYFEGSTKIYGRKGDTVSMVFNTQNAREAYYSYPNATISDCPPGYSLNYSRNSCVCSVDSLATYYQGITKCSATEFRAYIRLDYWAGYHNGNLYTAPCTFSVCAINSAPGYHHPLPKTASKSALNRMMCGEHKSGLLCGSCGNFSAYFHSNSQKCGPEDKCPYSAIFYILSELIPVVILFTLIVHFNIPLTAGGITGLVFFSQMVVTLPTDVDKVFHKYSHEVRVIFKCLQTGYVLIYNLFNFDFFSIDELSFCLWGSAKPMDVLVVKYVTTLFTLALIYILICIMNSRWYMKRTRTKKPRSVIHGLSAFLILAFAQCASVTFKILSYKTLRSTHNVDSMQVTHYGGLDYFGSNHLVYAISALFFLVFLVLLPPVLLLAYPLLLQLLALCRLSEHPLTLKLLSAVQLNRLIPLFDSFQSCYKDKLRFFAGLYFVYKMLLLLCYSLTTSLTAFYASSEAIILVIHAIHSIAQPYKKRVHNIIDSCLFFNLGIIVGLSAYNHYLATTPDFPMLYNLWVHLPVFLSSVQIVLTYTPIVASLAWCVSFLVKRRRRRGYQRLESLHNMEDRGTEGEDKPEVISS